MKKQSTIAGLVIAALLGILLWKKWDIRALSDGRLKEQTTSQSVSNLLTSELRPETGRILEKNQTSTGLVVQVEIGGVVREMRIPATMNLSDEEIIDLAADLMKEPVEKPEERPRVNARLLFYGLVVDESSNAVAVAQIKSRVLVTEGHGDGGFKTFETVSDGMGRFSFDVAFGQQLSIEVSKEPEYLPSPYRQFVYFRKPQQDIHRPDSANPVAFTLTKKQPPEKLFEIDKWWGAKNTGEPVHIDLTTGERVPSGGDIVVSIECPEPFKAGDKIPWRLVIEAPGGGLATAPEERLDYMLTAPQTGYEAIEVVHEKNAPDWNSQFSKLFYLKSRNGEIYAKLLFHMHTQWDERGVPFGFKAFVNTNGSRNLQGLP